MNVLRSGDPEGFRSPKEAIPIDANLRLRDFRCRSDKKKFHLCLISDSAGYEATAPIAKSTINQSDKAMMEQVIPAIAIPRPFLGPLG